MPKSTLKGRGYIPSWTPTSELELYKAEQAILGPIRPMICQRTVAGLNTIATVHPKVRSGEGLGCAGTGTPPATDATGKPPTLSSEQQQEALRPLDADNYTSVVFVHGYAGGVANWLPIWKTIAADHDVYAMDIPGFGRNERPRGLSFPTATAAIDWYVDQLEGWLTAMRIGLDSDAADGAERPHGRRIILFAHSFGGYLCSQLLMRHPYLVDHLILMDAWGINRFAPRTAEENAARRREMGAFLHALDGACEGIYWGKLLTFMGPLGRRLLPLVRPEFKDTWGPFLEDPDHFYDYSYHCVVQKPFVGEAAFEAMRARGGISGPRLPLIDLTHHFPFASEDLKQKKLAELAGTCPEASAQTATGDALLLIGCTAKERHGPPPADTVAPIAGEPKALRKGFKVTLLYGERSWVRTPQLEVFAEKLRTENGLDVSLSFIDGAGHMPLVDNMVHFMEELAKRL